MNNAPSMSNAFQTPTVVGKVPLRSITRLARQIGKQFQVQRVVLFGSYAYGSPHRDSDVDLLVIMPTHNMRAQASRIRDAIECSFPLDLLVRTPEYVERRIAEGDWFLSEIVERGRVVYEEDNRRVGAKIRSRSPRRSNALKDQAQTK